ncbi:MAG: TetR/AcrR family transcriptional regulator [Gammaproteobacteria bacterium]|nr:TetR/AcrR family transcriptional regulator [Gammaproteobacteria bacterium]
MPWEKSFDVNETLDAAMQVFWQQGYQRTSMQDLIKSMGINPGSIYGTFGNKRDLFMGVLRHYQQQLTNWFAGLIDGKSPKNAILAVFESILEEELDNPGHCPGCLLVNTALEVAPHDEEISQLVQEGFNGLRTFYKDSIIKGQSRGEINTVLDANIVADSLVAFTLGLRVVMRLPSRENEIKNAIKQVEMILE